MSIDLLPCPFCGGEAFFHDGADNDGQFVAVGCECGVGTGKHYPIMDDARPNAANEWNKRAPLASRALPAAADVGEDKPDTWAVAWAEKSASTGLLSRVTLDDEDLRDVDRDRIIDLHTPDQVTRLCEQAKREAYEKCIAALKKEREAFLSEEYAYPQPMGSFSERFACDRCIEAVEALAEKKP